jgi:hypothetical protein
MKPIEQQVADELANRGHRSTYEYPGFVSLADRDGSTWATGTANETWTVDHTDANGHSIGAGDTYVRVDCTVAAVIADEVEKVLTINGAHTKRGPAIRLIVVCPSCDFDINPLDELDKQNITDDLDAGRYTCNSCGHVFYLPVDAIHEAQHALLVALGEA